MQKFTFYNPTKLYFGKGQLTNLSDEITKYGENILLVYGGGSIKRNGYMIRLPRYYIKQVRKFSNLVVLNRIHE